MKITINPAIDYTRVTHEKNNPKHIELSIHDCLGLLESMVNFLNGKNNELQQHIRTNKDKENQEIVDEMKRAYNDPCSLLISKECAEIIPTIIKHSTGKDIKDL